MTPPIFKLIALSWVIVFVERLFFWLWLWQLKEYHLGRFKAHFSTYRGKKLVFSLSNFLQLVLIFGWILTLYLPSEGDLYYWPFIWLLLFTAFFVLMAFWVLLKFATKRVKIPVLTKKIALLLLLGLLVELLIFVSVYPLGGNGIHLFLITYFVAPLIFAVLVWAVQPLVFFQRNKLLKRAQQKREKFKDLIVVGITGSYGKTSTKEFLAAILSQKFKVLKTKKHINAEIGIAQTILKELKPEHQVFIAEIGAYERGKIRQVCKMLQPRIGILTGINEQHMSTFRNQENIIKAKYELIEALPKDGLAIFNGSSEHCRALYEKTNISKKIVEFATNKFTQASQHLLPWYTENALMAATTAENLGMSTEEVAAALKRMKSPLEIKKSAKGFTIIDSTYSANPSGVTAHLDYLANQPGKKIIIMPCLIELGASSKEVHRRIGKKIGKVCDLAIITTQNRFKELKQGARSVGMPEDRILLLKKPSQILEKMKNVAGSGDAVLLESRVPKRLIDDLS